MHRVSKIAPSVRSLGIVAGLAIATLPSMVMAQAQPARPAASQPQAGAQLPNEVLVRLAGSS